MKQVMIMPIVMAFSTALYAQDGNVIIPKDFKPVTVTKTKITCTQDRRVKVLSNPPGHQEQISKGKSSESIRTSWINGDTEYRFSEFTGYTNDGKDVRSKGRSMAKIVTKTEGNQVTETSQMRQVINYVEAGFEIEGGNLQQYDSQSVSVYQVNGNKRTLISAVEDGKVAPTNGAEELEIKLNDKQKVVQYTEKTPYFFEDGDFKEEVLKSDMTCLFETIK